MDICLIAIVSFIGAGLTLFSGFGLGTLLMPVFGLFFPIDLAIALTAIVHLANNLIKFGFFHKTINWAIVLRFGIPSIAAAFLGAFLLGFISNQEVFFAYSMFDHTFSISPVNITIALLLLVFSLLELIPRFTRLEFDKKYMPLGGLLSGFFGGISGNQGALRAAFLIRAGMNKEFFIGTSVVIACLVDFARLSIYSKNILSYIDQSKILLLVVAVLAALSGVFIGTRLLKKITIASLQMIVAIMLLVFALFLGAGIV